MSSHSSSLATLSVYAAASSSVATGSSSSSYGTKAVPSSSKISLFSSELEPDQSSEEMEEEDVGDNIITTS